MRVPTWLYLILVIGGVGGLTLLLSFVFFYAFQVSSDYYIFSMILAPFFVSLPTAYAILSRRFNGPGQRRLLISILITFSGMIMFLSGIAVTFSSFSSDSIAPTLVTLTVLVGFILVMHGFSLALPGNAFNSVLRDVPIQPDLTELSQGEIRSYLPAAGVATLIASILTTLVTFLTIPTAMESCSSNPNTCIPASMIILGVLSSIAIVTGITATSSLLKERYRHTVPLGLIFLTITPLLIVVFWNYWTSLALPILALCMASTALTVWNQKDSIKASDWRAIGILSACLGTIALVAGTLQFTSGTLNACQGVPVRPYLNNAGLLLSLGASGITFALLSVDSVRAGRGKPTGFLLGEHMKIERSSLFKALIILLTLSLASSTLFAGALVTPFFTQCRGFCPTNVEQVDITLATIGPSSNQATFTLTNSGTSYVTISQVRVWGGAISNPTYASQLSASTICAGSSNSLLVATFPGITFFKGTTYAFVLISANGNNFPYTFIA